MEKLIQGKFRLSSDIYHGEYYFNTIKEAEQKAFQLGWRHFNVERVVIEL